MPIGIALARRMVRLDCSGEDVDLCALDRFVPCLYDEIHLSDIFLSQIGVI